MSSAKDIKHPGRILEIKGRNIKVLILSQSACSNCHARGACGVLDMQEKIVDIEHNNEHTYSVNEEVEVVMKQSYGNKAVFFGYILPLIFVVITLLITFGITRHEGLAGILSLCILIPYYLGLYLLRDKLREGFKFSMQKQMQI